MISVDDEVIGRVEFLLYHDCPITSANFLALCDGSNGIGKMQKPLHFKGNNFHRIVPEFMI